MTNFTAMLSPKRANGQWRRWKGEATDWDDAVEKATKDNPGWTVNTCHETVEGAGS